MEGAGDFDEMNFTGDSRNSKSKRGKPNKVRYNVQESIKRTEKAEKRILQSQTAKGIQPSASKLEQKQFSQIQSYYESTSRSKKNNKNQEEEKINQNSIESNPTNKQGNGKYNEQGKKPQKKNAKDFFDS